MPDGLGGPLRFPKRRWGLSAGARGRGSGAAARGVPRSGRPVERLAGVGFVLYNSNATSISNAKILRNAQAGLWATNGLVSSLSGSTIEGNGTVQTSRDGIEVLTGGEVYMAWYAMNSIQGNAEHEVYLSGSGRVHATNGHNTICDPGTTGKYVYNNSSYGVLADNNYWGSDNVSGSWFYGPVTYYPWDAAWGDGGAGRAHRRRRRHAGGPLRRRPRARRGLRPARAERGRPGRDRGRAASTSGARPADLVGGEDAAARSAGVLPTEYALGAPYPNPSSQGVSLPVALPEAAYVRVGVYDLLGREVAVVAEGRYEAGRHVVALDGSRLRSGLYVVRASLQGDATSHVLSRRVTIVR